MNRLPAYVYLKKGRYVYVPYYGKGKRGKEITLKTNGKLLRADTPYPKIWAAFDLITRSDNRTLAWLIDEYLESAKFSTLKPRTRENYRGYRGSICNKPLKGGKRFGDTLLGHINIKVMRKYLNARTAKVAGNREMQFMKAVYSWARQYIDEVTENPCVGVDLNKESPRDRYITHDEYDLVYKIAKAGNVKYIPIAMELAYLCRARLNEILAMIHSDILEQGVYLRRGKGSESEVTEWTPRLRQAVNEAMQLFPKAPAPISGSFLLHDKKGLPIKKNAFDSARQRIMAKAKAAGLEESFTFHDLKAKGISDHEHKYGGHKSGKMKRVYDRLPAVVKATK